MRRSRVFLSTRAKRTFVTSSIVLCVLCTAVLLTTCTIKKQTSIDKTKSHHKVEITTNLGDNQEYIEGDEISFLVSISNDAYLLIVYQDANEHLWQLIPNDFQKQSKFSAGMYIPIPNESHAYKFRATAPFGKERLTVFASDSPFQKLQSSFFNNGLPRLDTTTKELKKKLWALSVKNSTKLTTSSLTITTQKRP